MTAARPTPPMKRATNRVLSGARVPGPLEPWKLHDHVVVIGSGALPARCIRHLLDAGVRVDLVIEPELDQFSTLEHLARQRNLRYRSEPAVGITERITSLSGSRFILSANNNYLFPQAVTEARGTRIVNFHGGLLPGYAGRNTATWVVFNNETRHGATWHLVDLGVDTGPILARGEFPLAATATAGRLMTQAMAIGFELFRMHWRRFLDPAERGLAQERPNVLYRRHQLPNGGVLRLEWSFEATCRFLRAMDYGPVRVVPPPRIALEEQTFEVVRYCIVTCSAPNRGAPRLERRDGGQIALLFPEGAIELWVRAAPERME